MLISFQSHSQKVVKTDKTYTVDLTPKYYEFIYNGNNSDTVTTSLGDSVFTFIIFTNKTDALYSNHQTTLSKIGSTSLNANYYLLGKYFSTDTKFDTLCIATFKGTVTDTTINTKLFTNKLGYNYYIKKVVVSSGKLKFKKDKSYYRK